MDKIAYKGRKLYVELYVDSNSYVSFFHRTTCASIWSVCCSYIEVFFSVKFIEKTKKADAIFHSLSIIFCFFSSSPFVLCMHRFQWCIFFYFVYSPPCKRPWKCMILKICEMLNTYWSIFVDFRLSFRLFAVSFAIFLYNCFLLLILFLSICR